MTDPQMILGQARYGPVPPDWRVFTKRRGRLSGFLHGTSHDPDPLLVITPEGAVEYANEHKPPVIVAFYDLAGIELQVRGQSSSDSSMVSISVWIDLYYRDGGKAKWRSASFASDMQAVQGFIEAWGAYRACGGR
ncbi:hypothetical protein RMN57_00265 [Kitasatospora sp. CM 4170]|uniref:Uncharacterized protein n=1 Tax=Kitasatospora aburaviensis TaxID=67265 RepID=A0ABW1F5M2_9ACTN|nr:hypothetical protein [Kitasatospora sp. CM 4170]WNM43243.1 hypothetical protein RMN57_00265 [Kitasatospora sp. CM 4170]